MTTLNTLSDFDSLPEDVQRRLMDTIRMSMLINGADIDEHPDFQKFCVQAIHKMENHPEYTSLMEFFISPSLEENLKVRILNQFLNGFME